MAIASKKVKEIIENVSLTLSYEEAEVLQAILDRVGGSPSHSLRKYVDSVGISLRDIGISGQKISLHNKDKYMVGNIMFLEIIPEDFE